MHGRLNARTTTSPTTSPVDRPTPPGAQTVRAAVIIHPYSVTAATSLFPQRIQGQRVQHWMKRRNGRSELLQSFEVRIVCLRGP